MALTFQLTVFSDPQGEAAARVYVVAVPNRDAPADELAAYRLSGQIIGPTCRYSSTLQTKIPFHHRGLTPCGDRTALLAEALVPDPCYWSTELPFLYRAVGQITGTDADPTPFDQTFGIRSVGVLRNKLTFNGKVWVPRCIAANEVLADIPLLQWRETAVTRLTDAASDELCQAASETGVCIITIVRGGGQSTCESLTRLSRYPAVVASIIDSHESLDRELRTAAPNVLLGRFCDRALIPSDSDATQFLVVTSQDGMPSGMKYAQPTGLPVLTMSDMLEVSSLTNARASCDRLQRELAGKHDIAGYIVT